MRDLGLPYPTSIGRVNAGDWSSTVPERLVAEGRFGVRVGQTVAEAEAELRAVVAEACAGDEWLREHPVEVQVTGGRFASAAVPSDHPLPWAVGEAARDVNGRLPPFVGVPYGSDARLLIDHGATPDRALRPRRPRAGACSRRACGARGRRPLRARARGLGHARPGVRISLPCVRRDSRSSCARRASASG